MAIDAKMRPRYQREPQKASHKMRAHHTPASTELVVALIALAVALTVIWGYAMAYQSGYDAGERYAQGEV